MATVTQRALQRAEDGGEAISENLSHQLAALRKQVDDITHSVNSYGDSYLDELRHNAAAMAKQMRRQGRVVARQVGHQANVAGRAVHDNPVPVIVALGTIALISALVFSRD